MQEILSFCTKIADRIPFYYLRGERGLYGSECVPTHPFSECVLCVCKATLERSSADTQMLHGRNAAVRAWGLLSAAKYIPSFCKTCVRCIYAERSCNSDFIISKGAFQNCLTEVACHFNLICGKLLNKSSCLPQTTPRISLLMCCSAIKSV